MIDIRFDPAATVLYISVHIFVRESIYLSIYLTYYLAIYQIFICLGDVHKC